MFIGTVVEIFFDINIWNRTHSLFWINRANIKYYKMIIDCNFIKFTIIKLSKDTILKVGNFTGENGIIYTYI
jgi:hypothetical protein